MRDSLDISAIFSKKELNIGVYVIVIVAVMLTVIGWSPLYFYLLLTYYD